jgi:hypothetical protein
MKRIALALAVLALAGCAALTEAGHTGYSMEPVLGADGKATGGCKFTATDGKEYSSRSIAAASTADGCQVVVQEGASTAFQGQAIAGKALSVLPSFAPLLLPQGPAALALPQAPQPAANAPAPQASGPKL